MRQLCTNEIDSGGILAAGYSGGTYSGIDGVWGAGGAQSGPSPRYYAVQAKLNGPPEERNTAIADYLGL